MKIEWYATFLDRPNSPGTPSIDDHCRVLVLISDGTNVGMAWYDRFKCNFWAHVAGVSGYLEIENPPYWAYLNLPNEC